MTPSLSTPVTVSNDRREGGHWTYRQALKNHLLYAAASGVLFLLRPFPEVWLRVLGRNLGQLLYFVVPPLRRITMGNLARVYPDLTPRERSSMARRVYRQLGSYLGETVAQLHRPGSAPLLDFEDGSRRVLEHAVRQGRGVLFVSAHLGPWERVAGSLVRHGFPLTTVARESYDPRFAPLYEKLRGGAGVRAIYRGSPTAPLKILRTLRAGGATGGLLGVVMDLRSRVSSIEVPFLGSLASTPVGPARIALRARAAVVVGTAFPCGSGGLALRVTPVATADLEADEAGELELTRRLNAELSSRVLGFPEGWVWMHARWDRP